MAEKTCCVTGHRDIPEARIAYVEQELDRLPAGYFTRHTGGAVSSLFVNDVDTVRAL